MRARSSCVGLAALVALACATAETPSAGPDAHARLGQRIAELMRGLADLADDRLPQAMDLRTAEEQRRDEVAQVAAAMAASADEIRSAAVETRLDASERAAFQALAARLGDEAQALARAARRQPAVELPTRVAAVRATCNECHQRFRIPGAPDGR